MFQLVGELFECLDLAGGISRVFTSDVFISDEMHQEMKGLV
jgi:hypothetical protein